MTTPDLTRLRAAFDAYHVAEEAGGMTYARAVAEVVVEAFRLVVSAPEEEDRGVLLNRAASTGAHVVEARERLTAAEVRLRARPGERERVAVVEAAMVAFARAGLEREEAEAALGLWAGWSRHRRAG